MHGKAFVQNICNLHYDLVFNVFFAVAFFCFALFVIFKGQRLKAKQKCCHTYL